jgi:pyridoxamine 5'-phosphate oxidase
MRVDYRLGHLLESDLAPSPFQQFETWFGQACSAGILEPNAMTLATVDDTGRPCTRTVLLKHWDERGFVFFTNLESRKAVHIAANPNVSLLFPWLPLQRQVAINGPAVKTSTAEVLAYFAKRPFQSQLAAWASPQSRVISTRAVLEMKWEEMKRKFREGAVPLPSFWGGYRVVPREIEFWQGGESRLHDRFLYSRQPDESWALQRLAP